MSKTFMEALVEIIMLDDFVQRRKMLDEWSKRYLAIAHVEVEFQWQGEAMRKTERATHKESIYRALLNGLRDDPGVIVFQEDDEKMLCEMIAIRRTV